MPYTNVAKPTGSSYTNVSYQGGEFFDDAAVSFDSSTTFFNGLNVNEWTMVPRETYSGGLNAGMTQGLLIPLTISVNMGTIDPWTRVNKPT